ncbi:MAG: hypothetical protein ABI461_05060 [Polyangiaceae bacterium]
MISARSGLISSLFLISVFAGCASHPPEIVSPSAPEALRVTATAAADTAPKEDLRLVPPEAYMRTYLTLFGGLVPVDAQKKARGGDGTSLFDTWDDYISALGFPDYRFDVPRQIQTNALMVAAFERIGVALCDRALEHDLKAKQPVPMNQRLIYAFDVPKTPANKADDQKAFTPKFDSMHRTFLGYPAKLAPPDREARFYKLYSDTVSDHAKDDPKSRFSPEEEGWATVCYALVRHPEFHLY